MRNHLFPKKSALEVLTSKRQSLFKKRTASKIAKRDVGVFGGPGSGRYPRGSGKNPQASKRNISKEGKKQDAENIAKKSNKEIESVFASTGLVNKDIVQKVQDARINRIYARILDGEDELHWGGRKEDLKEVAEKYKNLLPEGSDSETIERFTEFRSDYWSGELSHEEAIMCIDAYDKYESMSTKEKEEFKDKEVEFDGRSFKGANWAFQSLTKEFFPTDGDKNLKASLQSAEKNYLSDNRYSSRLKENELKPCEEFFNKLKEEDPKTYNKLDKKYDLSFIY